MTSKATEIAVLECKDGIFQIRISTALASVTVSTEITFSIRHSSRLGIAASNANIDVISSAEK